MTCKYPLHVVFVCTGNICRSPMAQGLLEMKLAGTDLAGIVQVDSAATHAFQIGAPPSDYSQAIAARYGIDISHLRARKITRQDFFKADYIAAMDRFNIEALHAFAPSTQAHKIRLLLDYVNDTGGEIVDPYGQPLTAYREAFSLIQAGVSGLFQELQRRVGATSAGGR
jgi:protein-tyrosine phosphatase